MHSGEPVQGLGAGLSHAGGALGPPGLLPSGEAPGQGVAVQRWPAPWAVSQT